MKVKLFLTPVTPVGISNNLCNGCCWFVADALTDNGDILVYFHAESLNAFKPPEEWTQVVRQTHKEKRQESQE